MSKLCNAAFFQIFSNEEINYILENLWMSKLSAKFHFWVNYFFKTCCYFSGSKSPPVLHAAVNSLCDCLSCGFEISQPAFSSVSGSVGCPATFPTVSDPGHVSLLTSSLAPNEFKTFIQAEKLAGLPVLPASAMHLIPALVTSVNTEKLLRMHI